jgi:hypothetical protein
MKKHSGCKTTITKTWREVATHLKDAPQSIAMPVHGLFRSAVDLIEVKGVCLLHLDELPNAAGAKRKTARARA